MERRKVHEASEIGRAELATGEQRRRLEAIEGKILEVDQELNATLARLGGLGLDAELEEVATLLSDEAAYRWMRVTFSEKRRKAEIELARRQAMVDSHWQKLHKVEEDLQSLDGPTVGWTRQLLALHGARRRLERHWLIGDPAKAGGVLKDARDAAEGYTESDLVGEQDRAAIEQISEVLDMEEARDG